MVEAQEHKHDVAADEEQKRASKNWADEVDGGDDDEGTIGSQNIPQVPVVEVKPIPVVHRQKNARGEIIVSSIRLRDLEPKAKVAEVKDSESSESEEEPQVTETSKEEVKGKLDGRN
jgi:hypothetical protein